MACHVNSLNITASLSCDGDGEGQLVLPLGLFSPEQSNHLGGVTLLEVAGLTQLLLSARLFIFKTVPQIGMPICGTVLKINKRALRRSWVSPATSRSVTPPKWFDCSGENNPNGRTSCPSPSPSQDREAVIFKELTWHAMSTP